MGEVDDTLSPSTSSEASAPESGTEPETTAHPDSSTGSESSPTPESSTGSESSPTAGTATEPEEADAVAAARREAAEYLDHLRRLQAEFDNYRKRVLKEQTQAIELAAEPLVRRLLEVIDDFELALMAAEQKPDFDRFLHGVELVYAKLVDSLKSEGMERIEAKGRPFDPEQHEALMHSGEPGDGGLRVADVLRPGYRLRGRVIRPAGVRVEGE